MQLKFTHALFSFVALIGLAALPSGFGDAHSVASAQKQRTPAVKKKTAAAVYSCPMDPDVKVNKPGRCPKCGMNLRLVKDTPAAHGGHAPAAVAPAAATQPDTPAKGTTTEVAPNSIKIPDTTVYNQHGQKLNFYTDLVRGKTVAINFIFTTCTTICPPLTATFRKVQQELGERVGRDIELISISVDPTTDVPERLKEFSAKFKAAPGWTFVTGSKPEIDQLLNALGAAVGDKNDHTPMLLIGNDAAGYWTRTYGLAPASTLVKVVNEAASKSGSSDASRSEAEIPLPQANTGAPVTGAAAAALTTPVGGTPRSAGGAANFPNHLLLTQDNRPVRFYDDLLKNKIVLINFLFTTCKGACSPMTANLAKVQHQLGAHLGKEVVMLSFTQRESKAAPAAPSSRQLAPSLPQSEDG